MKIDTQNIYQERFEQYLSQGYSVFEAYEITLELYLDKKPTKCENRHEQFWSADFLWQHYDIYTWDIETINAKLIITEFFSQIIYDSHPLILDLFQHNDVLINEAIRLSGMIRHQNKFDFHKLLIEKHLVSELLKESYDVILKYYSEIERINKAIIEAQMQVAIKCPLQLYIYSSEELLLRYKLFCDSNRKAWDFVNDRFISVMGYLCSELLLQMPESEYLRLKNISEKALQEKIKQYTNIFQNSNESQVFRALYHYFLKKDQLNEWADIFCFDRGIQITIDQNNLKAIPLNNEEDLSWHEINHKVNRLAIYWHNRPIIEYQEYANNSILWKSFSSLIYAKQIHGIDNEITISNQKIDTLNSLLFLEEIKQSKNTQKIHYFSETEIQKDHQYNNFWISTWDKHYFRQYDKEDLIALSPIFKIGAWYFYLPTILQLYYSQTILVNRIKLFARASQNQRNLANAIENNINEIFQIRAFKTLINWIPNTSKYPDAGEIDLLAYRDNILFVIEAKSTYIRDTVASSHQHMINNQMKAGRQLKRKVKAIQEELQNNQELREKLSITNDKTEIIPLIIDTSIENDHKEFYGALKISIEELIIAISDHKDFLDAQFLQTDWNKTQSFSFYPNNSFSATRFIEVIRNNEVWNGMLDQNIDPHTQKIAALRKLAEQGDASAQNNIGTMYLHGENIPQSYQEALKWYQLAANQGLAESQYNLGAMYLNGQGIQTDYSLALKWTKLAALQNFAAAQSNLGSIYLDGIVVSKNYSEAFLWFELAAKQGYAAAQNNIGEMYFHGRGVQQSYQEALNWFQLAAQQEYPNSQYNIGVMYSQGLGVQQDLQKAFILYTLAAQQGHSNARSALQIIYEKETKH